MERRPRQKIETYNKTKNGMSNPVVAVILASILIFAVAVVIFFSVLHIQQENSTFRFSGMRRERDGYKALCDEKDETLAKRAEWDRRNNIQPPIELVVTKPCFVPDEQKILEPKEERK